MFVQDFSSFYGPPNNVFTHRWLCNVCLRLCFHGRNNVFCAL